MKTVNTLMLVLMLLPLLSLVPASPKSNRTAKPIDAKQIDSTVRGVTFEDFKQSVSDFCDTCSKRKWLDTSWSLWKAEKWQALEHLFTVDKLNNCFPPNSGALSQQFVRLDSGMLIDRYGGYIDSGCFHDPGKFVSSKGLPFPQRALPLSALQKPYRAYRVVKAIASVNKGQIIPWFKEPGLGIQYLMPVTIDSLKHGKYIVQISSPQ